MTSLFHPDAWRPFVAALRASTPPGVVETEFRGTVSSGGCGGSTAYDGDTRRRGLYPEHGDSPMDALMSLGASVDGPSVAVRALVTSSGDALVSIVSASPQLTFGMGSAVLESVQLVPGADPEPYRRVPVVYDDVTVSPQADAAVVTALVHQLLPEAQPAERSALAAAESRLGIALPEDVRALYLAADSGLLALLPKDPERFFGMQIIPLNDTDARAYLEPQARYLSWADGATEVVAPDPHERVQPLGVSPAWFPIGADGSGNVYVVDLRPGPRGTVGQVLFVDHVTASGALWLAPSLTELLTERPAEMADEGALGGLLIRVGPHSGKTVADVQPIAEVVYVTSETSPADLSPLAGHSRIRTLVTESAAVTDLAPISALPALEFLQLDVAGWQQLLRTGQVPSTLLAAGLRGRDDWPATIDVVNGLLAAWNQPPIEVTDFRIAAA